MPTLLLDKSKCLANIARMAGKAGQHQLSFRPHCKTHQSAEIANWFSDVGVSGITVSSFRMARYFADHGWNDILVAFPFNPLDLKELDQLAGKNKISILIENTETIPFLDKLTQRVEFYIDTDTGYGRSGVRANETEVFEEIIKQSRKAGKLKFSGFYCHAGHSYKTSSQKQRHGIHGKAMTDLQNLKEHFREYAPMALYGDTPNCSTQNDFSGVDEITPGNFVFYDLIQRSVGSCETDDIAVAMVCPVVGKYRSRGSLLIHGGAVHFSKETVELNGDNVFGETAVPGETGWIGASDPGYLTQISQEHGIMENLGSLFERTKIGDTIYILPAHSCLTANLMGTYRTLEGEIITTLNS
jgi:D-serine deaminase-like pyridoxal phosphate-dependent protein